MPEETDKVAVIKCEIGVPKEMKEIIDCLKELILDAKAGKSAVEIITENWQNFMVAIEGWDKLDDEVKSEWASGGYAWFVKQMGDGFGM